MLRSVPVGGGGRKRLLSPECVTSHCRLADCSPDLYAIVVLPSAQGGGVRDQRAGAFTIHHDSEGGMVRLETLR